MHDEPSLPSGKIGFHPGFFRASSDAVDVTIFGHGGHGGKPQMTVDPVVLAARAILGRVLATLGANEETWYEPAAFLAASDEQLRAAGLSRQKMAYLRDLADKFASGELSEGILHEFDDDVVIERVSAVKGIGRWTAEMFLIFSLGRPDVLPVDDLGVRRGMQVAYGLPELPKPEEMRRIAEPWRPYRSAGTWYMWRALGVELPEQGRGYKPPAESET